MSKPNPKVIAVTALDNYKLKIEFDNREERVFDVLPYLDKGVFIELKDNAYFDKVTVAFD